MRTRTGEHEGFDCQCLARRGLERQMACRDRQCGSVGDVHPFRRRPEAGAAIGVRSESGIRARKEGEIASRGSRGNGFPWSGGRGRKAPDHLELSGFTNPAWDVFGLS